ncbi:MAG: type IV pilus twitching motility protein PilT [Candidatus Theseobacter exili]|nr:type IV pilus twitching motility protein PilT [Candidatus Theseobacter exili]
MDITELLQLVVYENASDLHLTVGTSPHLRIDGALRPLKTDPLTPEDTEKFVRSVTSENHQEKLREIGGVDFGLSFSDMARFRVSIFKQKGFFGIVFRLIPSRLMTLEEIGLNPVVKDLLDKPRGLVLVTGPTGCGKSTTLASMVNYVNEIKSGHILTIEDPVEYFHDHKNCVITQREVGIDVPTFSEAIVRGLRQDPDIILVGEMRDLATMEAAITAAETGHLVLATLHTTGAVRTVDRIIDAFPTNQQEQIRTQLAASIIAVISQLLLPNVSGKGRTACFEMMIATDSIRNLIRENKTYRITSDIQTGTKYGMQTMDFHLGVLFEKGIISYDEFVSKAFEPDVVKAKYGPGHMKK